MILCKINWKSSKDCIKKAQRILRMKDCLIFLYLQRVHQKWDNNQFKVEVQFRGFLIILKLVRELRKIYDLIAIHLCNNKKYNTSIDNK